MIQNRILRYGFLLTAACLLAVAPIALGILLTGPLCVFSAVPLRVLRRNFGRLPYWLGLLVAAGAVAAYSLPLSLPLIAMTILIGVYSEVEEFGASVFTSGFVAVMTATGVTALGAGLLLKGSLQAAIERANDYVANFWNKFAMGNPNVNFDPELFVQNLPAEVILGFMVALFLALVFERRWMNPNRASETPVKGARELGSFRTPDFFVWIAIASVFGAFFRHGIDSVEVVSANVFRILIGVYFFQGLAIIGHVFRAYKVGPFWQSLWYAILIFQLFLLVSLLGFADFWLEVRDRLSGKPAESKKGI